jgi:processive 1,2-diacylglycerol beta-glucosyltransferase
MQYFPQTSIYQETLQLTKEILQLSKQLDSSIAAGNLENTALQLSGQVGLALQFDHAETLKENLLNCLDQVFLLYQQIDLLFQLQQISAEDHQKFSTKIETFSHRLKKFPDHRKRILILSSIMGQGHMSAANAVKEGIENLYGKNYQIDIIDFYHEIGEIFNKAVKSFYEGSTKHLPNFYKYLFETTDKQWQVKLLNIANYPLNATKIEKLFKSYNPDIVLSTFPIWDYLASLVLKKCDTKHFLSLVTDSISIHNAWVTGDVEFHIVANQETAISLKKLGVEEDKIKVLGFPVKLAFSKVSNRQEFWQQLNLQPDNFTMLLLPAGEKAHKTVKMVEEIQKNFPNSNLVVICGRSKELYPKLAHFNLESNIRIIGWTDQMPQFMKNCDLVITKAGGATVMECIAAEKPMIITQIIPGQEMGNAELIKLHNLGIIQKSAKMTITECIEYTKTNQKTFQKNLQKISNPLASLKIAEFINNLP